MENQHPVLAKESSDRLQRVSTGSFGPSSAPLSVVVAQIHGVDVKHHVRNSKQDKTVHQPVTVHRET